MSVEANLQQAVDKDSRRPRRPARWIVRIARLVGRKAAERGLRVAGTYESSDGQARLAARAVVGSGQG